MSGQGNSSALLSTERASETTTEATTTETTTTEVGAENATTGTETEAATTDNVTAEGAETVEAETGDEQTEPEGAPETYQFEAPEGVTVDMTTPEATAFTDFLRAENMSQAKGQQLFGMLANTILSIQTQQQADWDRETGSDPIDGQPSAWVKAVRTDALIGGDDAKLAANLGIAKRALDQFGDKDLDEVMTRFRLGNNPAILRAFYRAGLTLQEDTSIPRGGQTSETLSDAEVFFGSKD